MSLPYKAKQIDPLMDAIQWKTIYDEAKLALEQDTYESLHVGCSNAKFVAGAILRERGLDPDTKIMEQQ